MPATPHRLHYDVGAANIRSINMDVTIAFHGLILSLQSILHEFFYLLTPILAHITILLIPPVRQHQIYPTPYTVQMALNLYVPPCIHSPPHPHHPPSAKKPLRISIEGPLSSVNKLLPGTEWQLKRNRPQYQPAAPELAKLTFRTIYGQDIPSALVDSLIVRD